MLGQCSGDDQGVLIDSLIGIIGTIWSLFRAKSVYFNLWGALGLKSISSIVDIYFQNFLKN